MRKAGWQHGVVTQFCLCPWIHSVDQVQLQAVVHNYSIQLWLFVGFHEEHSLFHNFTNRFWCLIKISMYLWRWKLPMSPNEAFSVIRKSLFWASQNVELIPTLKSTVTPKGSVYPSCLAVFLSILQVMQVSNCLFSGGLNTASTIAVAVPS